MPEGVPVAQFRNVSGQDLELSLPQWFNGRVVEAGDVVDVEDDLVYTGPPAPEVGPDGVALPIPTNHHIGKNEFNPAIWEQIVVAPKSANKNTDGE
jgi:hypothetical protein